jgi:hypothetical protein
MQTLPHRWATHMPNLGALRAFFIDLGHRMVDPRTSFSGAIWVLTADRLTMTRGGITGPTVLAPLWPVHRRPLAERRRKQAWLGRFPALPGRA